MRTDAPVPLPRQSYRANTLGEPDALLTPHPHVLALGADDNSRRAAYRTLFRSPLDDKPFADLRMALRQNHPIGNDVFYREIEAMTDQRRAPPKRGRPRKHNVPLPQHSAA